MVIRYASILAGLLLLSATAGAVSNEEIRALIEQRYAGALIGDIEQDSRNGRTVYEVDFEHEGDEYEALISEDGRIIDLYMDEED